MDKKRPTLILSGMDRCFAQKLTDKLQTVSIDIETGGLEKEPKIITIDTLSPNELGCIYCGKEGYKTNGKGELICEKFAYSGSCEGHQPIVRTQSEKQSRNEVCNCGSGLKFKKCHGKV